MSTWNLLPCQDLWDLMLVLKKTSFRVKKWLLLLQRIRLLEAISYRKLIALIWKYLRWTSLGSFNWGIISSTIHFLKKPRSWHVSRERINPVCLTADKTSADYRVLTWPSNGVCGWTFQVSMVHFDFFFDFFFMCLYILYTPCRGLRAWLLVVMSEHLLSMSK